MTEPVAVPYAAPLATIPAVELMQTGQWDISTGVWTVTTEDIAYAAAAADCPAVRRPILKLGHTDPRFDGEPAVGWIDNLSVADDGHTLVGDYRGMPGWLGDVIASAYPDRSVEGWHDFACQIGHVHPFVLTGVALLGVTAPGIGTLGSLQDIGALYGVAAATAGSYGSPVTIRATGGTMPNPRPTRVAAGVTTEDVRRKYYDEASLWVWIEEMHLDPLQLIVIDDMSGKRSRVPVTVGSGDGEDAVTFGDAVPVVVRYEDAPSDPPATAASAGRIRYASRAESRPDVPIAAARGGRVAAGAVASHSTGTSDGSWDGPANEKRLSDDAGPSTFRKVYAWQDPDGDEDAKSSWKFPHHDVAEDGTPGAANVAGCRAGISVLNGGRGGSSIPDGDRQGVYNHLAKHIRDAGEEPAELASASTSAAAAAAGQEGTAAVSFTDEQLVTMRTKLGLPDDADEATIVGAMTEALDERAEPAPAALPEGTVAIDSTQLATLQAAAARGDQARAQQELEQRQSMVSAAVTDGRIPPARRDAWLEQLRVDPGSADVLAGLAKGLVPVEAAGHDAGTGSNTDPAAGDEYWFPGLAVPATTTSREG